jgi:hypothetical protein
MTDATKPEVWARSVATLRPTEISASAAGEALLAEGMILLTNADREHARSAAVLVTMMLASAGSDILSLAPATRDLAARDLAETTAAVNVIQFRRPGDFDDAEFMRARKHIEKAVAEAGRVGMCSGSLAGEMLSQGLAIVGKMPIETARNLLFKNAMTKLADDIDASRRQRT